MSEFIILAGDIGGTHIRYNLYVSTPTTDTLIKTQTFHSPDYKHKASIDHSLPSDNKNVITSLIEFLNDQPTPRIAVIGICGVVSNHKVTTSCSYGSWLTDTEISETLNIPSVFLLNDLEASGYGLLTLTENEYKEINGGQADPNGPIVCGSIGTGLGQCYLTKSRSEYLVHCSEGGFQDYSPKTEEDNELYRFCQSYYGSFDVAYGRLIAGKKMEVIYKWLREKHAELKNEEFDQKFRETTQSTAKLLLEEGFRGEVELAKRTVEIWERVIGYYLCNLFVNFLPTGGIYIIGGVVSKNFDWIERNGNIKKGFFGGVGGVLHRDMAKVPIYVVKSDGLGIRGSLFYARRKIFD